ncbi:MAG TPA: saccharopine dehydrogenase NADP-binding domain-containing protein [Stellaceae bacterium]|nr:saccharopine dehydrogenase NADP-binding domain-containing protein [Stellaceae bacterium]
MKSSPSTASGRSSESRFGVLVLGGAGVFGSRICRRLARDRALRVIAAGRSAPALERLAADIGIETRVLDAPAGLCAALGETGARLVIHTAGPFQGQDYAVAEASITAGAHYIDISDGRDFVCGFDALDARARQAGVLAVSGASSVPALSAAVIDDGLSGLGGLTGIAIGISPGNRAPRGPAVIEAFLGYTGKPIICWRDGAWRTVYGWQDLRRVPIEGLGRRWLSACDVPDLALFPKRYPGVKTVEFHAGIELGTLHLGLWALSWLVRARLVGSLRPLGGIARWIGDITCGLGTDRGGMYVHLDGVDTAGGPVRHCWSLVAEAGDGPFVPATPAVILARKLAQGRLNARGAMPCLGLFTLEEFRAEIADLAICTAWAAEASS